MRSRMVCAGCDLARPADEVLSFSCPVRGQDDVDHVLRPELDRSALRDGWPEEPISAQDNPFVRYRRLSHSWHLAMARGMSDERYLDMAESLAERLSEVDGAPPRVTPFLICSPLGCSIKNETVNVSGSHKGRHLIGTALHLAVADELGVDTRAATLAIASCGNAALAAAVVARAADRKLRVFIPPTASKSVVTRLEELGAEIVVCERRESDPAGDPCYLRFLEAVDGGALPFSCQGSDNALALVGGHSLGWELIEQMGEYAPTDVFLQVGGGALASSVMQAFSMAADAGIIESLPRFHVVQTENAHPMVRAWNELCASGASIESARSHRSRFMWPWESEPKSIAGGILDDETYDWLSIVTGLVASGGGAITISESDIEHAHERAHGETDIDVCTTGVSGFAGLERARHDGAIGNDSRPLVLFTGATR